MQNKENRFEWKRKRVELLHVSCLNSNTCVRQDMHAHGMHERCTHNNRSGKENVAYLYHYLYPRYGVSGG